MVEPVDFSVEIKVSQQNQQDYVEKNDQTETI